MPRGVRIRANVFVKTVPPQLITKRTKPLDGTGPRLWNAKRRIKSSQGLGRADTLNLMSKEYMRASKWDESHAWKSVLEDPKINMEWWKLDSERLPQFIEAHPKLQTLSQDVKDFLQKGSTNLSPLNVERILRNPAEYFAVPQHVPLSMRQQVYFPKIKDSVVLMRTPHLGPRYAAFDVPLDFNKLDLKAYLKDVYNVDVLHIRSVVIQQKVERKEGRNMYSQGAAFRAPSQKKMTCLLAKPFVYPDEPESLEAWEHTPYWESMKEVVRKNREVSEWADHNPDTRNRKAFALQAQQLLKGKTKWAPTWQNFADNRRVMGGLKDDLQLQPVRQLGPEARRSV